MTSPTFAIIAGVVPGTGASIARKFANVYSVVLLARNPASYEAVLLRKKSCGGQAVGISTDLADSNIAKSTFDQIAAQYSGSTLAAAVFNCGSGFVRKPFLELTEEDYSGSLASQAYISPIYFIPFQKVALVSPRGALPLLLKARDISQHPPTLIFTGAMASIKGSAECAAFASTMFALRALAQSLARKFGSQGVHVSRAIIDGVIDIPRTKSWKLEHEDAKLSLGAIAEAYWHLHTQPRMTITFEMDLRPYVEKW
ncbi:hypothetical protein N7481_000213 [Penicillium waksmanii]|uniref:uncharacterized protein n=1 Tax=Penicillium waksmanii TaxID=69791 RepID=UPI0025482832|nr:uncharacterized protein N7481_000213 [Penicillium waksmanii]KAJ5999804.1 hypothetical protein N7481_000213 [Penicillium waksmanii]